MYRILTLTTEFLKCGSILSIHSAGYVPNQVFERQVLPKHDLMTPGFGSRLTNFSNLREDYGFRKVDYSSNLKIYNNTNCMYLRFYDHMWQYDSICHIFGDGVLLRKVNSQELGPWPNYQLPQDETLCPWGTSQLCSNCVCTWGSKLALVKMRLFIFTSFICFSVKACR